MMHGLYRNNDNWAEEERRKKRDKLLMDGIVAYAFQELAKHNTDKDKVMRAVRVAMALERELDE